MSVIEEVKDFGNDLQKTIGKNGVYILIAAAGAFGIYNLLKKDNSSEYVSATGYASYPDVGENSEVVIDALSNEIWASNDQVVGAIETSESEIIQNVDDHFEETNGYIKEGLDAQEQIMQKMEVSEEPKVIVDSGYIYHDYESGSQVITQTPTNAYKPTETTTQVTPIKGTTTRAKKTTTSSKSKSTSKKTTSTKSTSTKSTSNKTSTKNKTSAAKKTNAATSPNTYNYTTKKGLNTSTSIVDALRATGADSSMSARKKIAAANGIKNYKGTASQNTKMLNMMKSGDLVKPTNTSSKKKK